MTRTGPRSTLASYALIGGGFWLVATAWRVLHEAARTEKLATTGPYARVRHPASCSS